MASSETISAVIQAHIPSIDQQLTDYIVAVLTAETFNSKDEVEEAVGEVLASCVTGVLATNAKGASTGQATVDEICRLLYSVLREDDDEEEDAEENGGAPTVNGGHKLLQQPVNLGLMANDFEVKEETWKSIWSTGKEVESKVDTKKLQKAEDKLKQKAEKRDNVPASDTAAPTTLMEATASQVFSKKVVKQEASGVNRAKDIKVENFDVSFGSHVLLQGAELNLSYGLRYGLCGRNGIGKSTLLKMLSNGSLVIPSHISILHVEQEVVGDDTTALNSVLECDTARTKLLAEEAILAAKSNLSMEESTRLNAVYAELMAMEADKAPARASIILAGLGFTPEMQARETKTFSGGWRMRIALARALFSRPDLLLLDEPTNMLDMKAIIWLTGYLVNNWTSTLLVVSHDRSFLSEVPNAILHFHARKIETYRGNYDSFMASMTEKLRNQQREYEAQQMHRKHTQEFIDRFRYNSKRASLVQSRIKQLDKMEEVEAVEVEPPVVLRFPSPEALSPPILQLDGVTFGYTPERVILRGVNLNANFQSRICIVGDNGSGKTTLLKLLTGELEPSSGIRHTHRNLAIGYFTQHHVDQLSMNQSPLQFMASKDPGKNEEHYRRYLGGFGITGDLGLQSLATLSGGQKSRVAFAAMTLTNPHVLILDEPTNHLDIETVEGLAKALNEFTGGVILVTHDQTLIRGVCTELWHCAGGSVTCLKGGFEEYKKIIEKELNDIAG